MRGCCIEMLSRNVSLKQDLDLSRCLTGLDMKWLQMNRGNNTGRDSICALDEGKGEAQQNSAMEKTGEGTVLFND